MKHARISRQLPAPRAARTALALRLDVERRGPSGRDSDEADPWRRDLYEPWAARLGEAKMRDFLRMLDGEMRALLRLTAEQDRAALRDLAHDVAATAGMLGFCEVTCRCRAVLESDEDGLSGAAAVLADTLAVALDCLGQYLASDAPVAKAA